MLLSAEDDPADVIRPRLDAAGADASKVHLLTGTCHVGVDGQERETMFTLADVGILEEAITRLPDCRLVVVDPIGSYLGGKTDAHRDNEVRAVLTPVGKLAERHGAAVVIVAHRRKASGDIADDHPHPGAKPRGTGRVQDGLEVASTAGDQDPQRPPVPAHSAPP